MPLYEYQCNVCEEITEEFDKITSTNKTIECSFCGQSATKIMSLSNFHLKGGGWSKEGYSGKKIMSIEEKAERSTVKVDKINVPTGEKTTISEKPFDIKSLTEGAAFVSTTHN